MVQISKYLKTKLQELSTGSQTYFLAELSAPSLHAYRPQHPQLSCVNQWACETAVCVGLDLYWNLGRRTAGGVGMIHQTAWIQILHHSPYLKNPICLARFKLPSVAYIQQQQQLSHLSQVFGVGYMNQKRITLDRAHGFLHSFLSSNMPSLRPLASISYRITSIHDFFGLPCALLTCPKLIRSTRRTGASVGLCRTWSNHRTQFSLIFSSIEAIPILVRISSFLTLSLRVLSHIQRSMRISTTLILWAWCLFITQHSVHITKLA